MSSLFQQYQYKKFNIYNMLKGGYCFITNNSHDINDTPTYDDILFLKSIIPLAESQDIIFHFDGVFGLIVIKEKQIFFSKHFHYPENHGQLKVISSFFEDIPSFVFGQKPIQLN